MKTARKKTPRFQDEKRDVRFADASEPWWLSFPGAPQGASESRFGSAARVPCGKPGQIEGHPAAPGKREGRRPPAECGPLVKVDHGTALFARLVSQYIPSAENKAWRGGRVERAFKHLQRHFMSQTERPDLGSVQARLAETLRTAEAPERASVQGRDEALKTNDRGRGPESSR